MKLKIITSSAHAKRHEEMCNYCPECKSGAVTLKNRWYLPHWFLWLKTEEVTRHECRKCHCVWDVKS